MSFFAFPIFDHLVLRFVAVAIIACFIGEHPPPHARVLAALLVTALLAAGRVLNIFPNSALVNGIVYPGDGLIA